MTVVPIREQYDNWRAAIAHIVETQGEIEKMAIWVQPKTGAPRIVCYELMRSDLAFIGAMLLDEALHSP